MSFYGDDESPAAKANREKNEAEHKRNREALEEAEKARDHYRAKVSWKLGRSTGGGPASRGRVKK